MKTLLGIWWRRGRVVLGAILLAHTCVTPFILLIVPLCMLLGFWLPNWKPGAPVQGTVGALVAITVVSLIFSILYLLDNQRYRRYGNGEFTLEDRLNGLFRDQMTFIKNFNTLFLVVNLLKLHNHRLHLGIF